MTSVSVEHSSECPFEPFMVSECGCFVVVKSGSGLLTSYNLWERDEAGRWVSQFAADRLWPFYVPFARWTFPFTSRPSPEQSKLVQGCELLAEGPRGCSRVVSCPASAAFSVGAVPSGIVAILQLWDGQEWVDYIHGDMVALRRLIGFHDASWYSHLGVSGELSPVESGRSAC